MRESQQLDVCRRLAACAVFDLDGTLVDTAPTHEWAINTALSAAGAPTLESEAVRRCIGHGPRVFVDLALERVFGAELATVDPEVVNCIHSTFIERLTTEPTRHALTRDRADELLRAIGSQGGRIGVCTNKPQHLAMRVLADVGLMPLVEVVVGGDAVSRPKPSPDSLLHCIERLSSEQDDAVLIGDSSIDLEAGAAAGIPVILITGGYEPGEFPINPQLSVDGFDELVNLLLSGSAD